jgi:hypothetical protein
MQLTLAELSASIRALNTEEQAGKITPAGITARGKFRELREKAVLLDVDTAHVAPAQKPRKKKTATEEVSE